MPDTPATISCDAVIIGAGITGSLVAWNLSRKGFKVAVIESQHPASGATGACNGGLSYTGKPPVLLEPALESLAIYRNLEKDLQLDLECDQKRGLVLLAEDEEDVPAMLDMVLRYRKMGLKSDFVSGNRVKDLVPIDSDFPGGITSYDDLEGMVNPFRVVYGCLRRTIEAGGWLYLRTEVTIIESQGGSVSGVVCKGEGPASIRAPLVVDCGGATVGKLEEPLGLRLPIIPCKGIVLVTEETPLKLRKNIMTRSMFSNGAGGAAGSREYSVALEQTASSNILIGGSREYLSGASINSLSSSDFPFISRPLRVDSGAALYPYGGASGRRVDAEVVKTIARNASRCISGLERLNIIRVFTGLRPHTPDGLPVIGEIGIPGLLVASGLGGYGITLGPWVGRVISDMASGAEIRWGDSDVKKAVSPLRFRGGN